MGDRDTNPTETVARAIGRLSPELQPYVLKEVSITERRDVNDVYRRGADAEVIDLDWRGTECVGKLLHPIFFQVNTESFGMERILKKFFAEMKLLSEMRHPNIVQFLGIHYKQDSSLEVELPVLVMEKMKCSLNNYLSIHERGSIPEYKVIGILSDVSKGLVYLHEEVQVAHRDLSSNNILLTEDLNAKIADLGSARVLDRPGGWKSQSRLSVQPGTQDFMPPEALADPPEYTVSVDVFSFGCVIIHLCTHRWPTPIGKTDQESRILTEVERRQKFISEMNNLFLLKLVKQCLDLCENRPTSTWVLTLLEKRAESIKESKFTYIERCINDFTKPYENLLKQYTLADVKEISQGTNVIGSYKKIIDINFNDTHCVGKVLYSACDTNPSRIQYILEKALNEIQILSKSNHLNVVRFIGIYYQQASLLPVLVMEKLECTLTKYLSTHEKGSVNEDKTLKLLLDISRGLVYLHKELNIAHRNLSSNSILLTGDLSAKISDLGLGCALDRPERWQPLPINPDTMDFLPHEASKHPPEYNDIFSFGCVIIHVCTHKWPAPNCMYEGQVVNEVECRHELILDMADSYLLPMAMQCLAVDQPNSTAIMSSLQSKAEEIKPDYTIVFAGMTGSGKSTAGNVFLNKEVFSTEDQIILGTSSCSAHVSTICGKTVKIIDTPGFFDGFISNEDHFRELGRALTLAKDGIHAVAFVMSNIRYTTQCKDAIEQILRFEGLQPYLFVLLTNAKGNGLTKVETDKYIQKTLSDKRCAPGFKDLMQLVENRVIMLECNPTEETENYFVKKREEFITMINKMHQNLECNYTNNILLHTAQLYEKVRLQQNVKIQKIKKMLQLNVEEIDRERQVINTMSSANSRTENDCKIAALTEKNEMLKRSLQETEGELYLKNHVNGIIVDEMKNSYVNERNVSDFLKKYGARGYFIGAIIGTIVLPVVGTYIGAKVGCHLGHKIALKVSSITLHNKDCKLQ